MKNNFLEVTLSPKGAELTSIRDCQTGFEFLWQADPAVWGRHAPILFPIVGKVLNNQLCIEGAMYPMGQHGFARDCVFTLYSETETETWFELTSSEATLAVFPYPFELRLGYRLTDHTLTCLYQLTNTGTATLPFSIGAHPGFNLPTQLLSDYEIRFAQKETEERQLLSDGLFNGSTKPVLTSPHHIRLSRNLFDDDAIVFKHLNSKQLELKQTHGTFNITLTYDGFPYMGIWTQKGNEQYICLEPWCGHADSVDGHADFSIKEGIETLTSGGVFERSYALTFTPPTKD
jgi:galactose mutarotase-like enzyme